MEPLRLIGIERDYLESIKGELSEGEYSRMSKDLEYRAQTIQAISKASPEEIRDGKYWPEFAPEPPSEPSLAFIPAPEPTPEPELEPTSEPEISPCELIEELKNRGRLLLNAKSTNPKEQAYLDKVREWVREFVVDATIPDQEGLLLIEAKVMGRPVESCIETYKTRIFAMLNTKYHSVNAKHLIRTHRDLLHRYVNMHLNPAQIQFVDRLSEQLNKFERPHIPQFAPKLVSHSTGPEEKAWIPSPLVTH